MSKSVQKLSKIASYKDTLNLPKTLFAMKANLVQNEPATLKKWQQLNLYNQVRAARKNAPKYVFHDGPPYANGPIHLGHLLNKVLKDFIVRSKTMAGFDCPYTPGWDCHGLPIEHKVMQNLADKAKQLNPVQIRHRCQQDAEKFIKLQSSQMQRLLTLADYDHPYITMDPAYEAAVLEVFADLVAKGLVYRDFKPVAWSIENQTALAEAELEYEDVEDTSIYVLFKIADNAQLPQELNAPAGKPVYLVIWTTTPWTLPANMAVAASGKDSYSLWRFNIRGKSWYAITIDSSGSKKVLEKAGAADIEELGFCRGKDLEKASDAGLRYLQPITGWKCPVISAAHVSVEDGTGLVHTAPGHGQEDFQSGKEKHLHFSHASDGTINEVRFFVPEPGKEVLPENLKHDIYSPVLGDGTYDNTVPAWLRGVNVWAANKLIIDRLAESEQLLLSLPLVHSYPHDWRSKTKIIFRATKQWFMAVTEDSFRRAKDKWAYEELQKGKSPEAIHHKNDSRLPNSIQKSAIEATDQISFIPEWGRNRMRGMLESRPDWCISRQRAWGLPIPVFYTPDGTPLLTRTSVLAVADAIRKHGSDYWFKATPEELLATYQLSSDPDAPNEFKTIGLPSLGLRKGSDIFDVWFESGSSWHAVLEQRDATFQIPADLYLEGSDQHRGWFQSSLLPALGARGKPPFKTVLTHGFMVDKDGRKMSKSLGNALEVETLLKDYGADVCRWWVCGLNTDNDIKVDPEFFKVAGEEYRKVRNTIRFLLSNLYDFDPRPQDEGGHRYAFSDRDAVTLDAWALGECDQLIEQVRHGYDTFRFRKAHVAVFHFCNETLSAVYLTAVKDRLYCDKPDSPRRRRTQTAIYDIVHALIRLLAPILPHTADEAWAALNVTKATNSDSPPTSVHLELFPALSKPAVDPRWSVVMQQRDTWLKTLEETRQKQQIDNPLDLGLIVSKQTPVPEWGSVAQLLEGLDVTDLADLCGVSRFELEDRGSPVRAADLRDAPRCARSWKRDSSVRLRSDGGLLSDRDAAAVGVA